MFPDRSPPIPLTVARKSFALSVASKRPISVRVSNLHSTPCQAASRSSGPNRSRELFAGVGTGACSCCCLRGETGDLEVLRRHLNEQERTSHRLPRAATDPCPERSDL